MKKNIIIVFSIIAFFILAMYGIYAYVANKIAVSFKGVDTSKLNVTSVQNIGQTIGIELDLKNNSNVNVKLKKFRAKFFDEEGAEVLEIKEIPEIFVPKNGSSETLVESDVIDTPRILRDAISGDIKKYRFTIRASLGGVIPFKYTGKVEDYI